MKKTIAIGLITVIFSTFFRSELLSLYFKMNQAEIAGRFCINKHKPAMKCMGKCFLHKIVVAQEKDQQGTSPLSECLLLTLKLEYIGDFAKLKVKNCKAGAAQSFHHTSPLISRLIASSPFHPPEGFDLQMMG